MIKKVSSNTKQSPTLRNTLIVAHISKFVKPTLCILLALILSTPLFATSPTILDDEASLDRRDQTGAYYHNPNGNNCVSTVAPTSLASSGYERLKEAVRLYGQTAMDVQRKWGTPWEVVFAQMQKESSTGTTGVAIHGATNNWLGIKGTGDAGTFVTTNSQGEVVRWAVYSSIEASIEDWAGPRVLRHGPYDIAFTHLDPSNYSLEQFINTIVPIYAPPSGNNNTAAYINDILSFINGPINTTRLELGWPSSAELASAENIPIGGEYPIGSHLSAPPPNTINPNCIGRGNGDINQTAIDLSWPDRTHSNTDPKPSYRQALNAPDGVATLGQGDDCARRGDSCDAFVAAVMRYSGVDPSFPCCTAVAQLNYLKSHPELYREIPNTGSAADLLPGDIRVKASHIDMYVVLPDGSGRIASASHCQRTADHEPSFFPDSAYRIFRKL
jgi:hypothetical protein